jgi:P2-related tail formation protein
MHRNKGTHGGVMDALAMFGVTPDIVYWHEMQPEGEPGTMQLTIWVNDNLLSESGMMFGPEMLRDVKAQLERSKRASIHYTFRLGVEAEKSGFGTAFSAQLTTRQKVTASNNRNRAASTPIGAGVGFSAQLATRQDVTAASTRISAGSQPSGHGLGWSAQLTTKQHMAAVADRVQAAARPAGVRMGFSAQIYTRQCVRAVPNGNAPRATGLLHMPLRMASSIQMTTLLRLEATK